MKDQDKAEEQLFAEIKRLRRCVADLEKSEKKYKRIEEILKESEDALKESEEQFRSLFQNSIVGITLTVHDGRIIAANPAALKMFGYSEDEMLSVGRNGLVDSNDTRLPALLVDMARTGKFKGELKLIKKWC